MLLVAICGLFRFVIGKRTQASVNGEMGMNSETKFPSAVRGASARCAVFGRVYCQDSLRAGANPERGTREAPGPPLSGTKVPIL